MRKAPFHYIDIDSLEWDGTRLWFTVVRPPIPARNGQPARPEGKFLTCLRAEHLAPFGFEIPEADPYAEDAAEFAPVKKEMDADTRAYLEKQQAQAEENRRRLQSDRTRSMAIKPDIGLEQSFDFGCETA